MKTRHLLAFIALATASATAAPQTFDFKDPKGVNNATFRLDAPLETITGTASGVSGTLVVDPGNPAATKGSIIIDAKSLHVENPVMKEHMHGPDWMNTAEFGEITFEVKSMSDVVRDGDKVTATVNGAFTMKGVTKEISVPATATMLPGMLAQRTNGQAEGDLLVVRTQFSVKRADFGINPTAPTDKVSEDVEITLAIAGASPKG